MGKWVFIMNKKDNNIYRTRVRYADTDQMGVAHHARYFEWFESARTDFIRRTGVTYRELENQGFLLPVVEVSCHYIKAVHYDDVLLIHTSVDVINRLRLQINYELYIEGYDVVFSKGFTKHCFMNKAGRPVRASAEVIDLFYNLSSMTE